MFPTSNQIISGASSLAAAARSSSAAIPAAAASSGAVGTAAALGLVTAAAAAIVVTSATVAAAMKAYEAEQDLAKAKQSYENSLKRYQEASTGTRSISDPPPFTGGQGVGVAYTVVMRVTFSGGNTLYVPRGLGFGLADRQGVIDFANSRAAFIGPISGFTIQETASEYNCDITPNGGRILIPKNQGGEGTAIKGSIAISDVLRRDGQPDTSLPSLTTNSPAGYTSTPNEQDRNKVAPPQPKIVPPYLSPTVGWGRPKAIDGRAALGIGTGLAPSPTRDPERPLPNPNRNPSPAPPSPNRAPSPPPTPEEDRAKRIGDLFVPKSPATADDIRKDLTELFAITGVIAGNINQVKNNTEFSNLKNAAAEGSCQSLNSPSCTQSLKDDIKNPINQNVDAKAAALTANQIGQDIALANIISTQATHTGFFGTIIAKGNDIFEFLGRLWNNSIIDKAVGYLTLITVIHNAAMLSRSIAETLGSAIDQGLVALGWGFSDKDGNIIGINQAIGNSIQDLLRKSLGNAVYEGLSNTFTQANRVYQAGINLLSSVQNIIDSTTAVAELTSNRVANLMNALRSAGVVREDAYGSQTPNTTRFNAFMQKLENLEQGTSNLAAITGNIVSVQQSVNELKSNRTEFENAIQDKNTVVEADRTEKREDSTFKIGDFSITRAPEQTP